MARNSLQPSGLRSGGPDRLTLVAFITLVIIGGSNAVAVRFSNLELPPFWGAAIRFIVAAFIFWAILLIRRVSLPKGRALSGILFYGVLSIGFSYALIYWSLLEIQAGLAMIVLAIGPLLTMFFAILHGLERFRWRGLAGALVSLVGISLGVGQDLGNAVPIASLIALLAGAVCIAEASVLFKLLPKTDPIAVNAIAMTSGVSVLILVSLFAQEAWHLPSTPVAWGAFSYLAIIGSVGLFFLYLFVLERWTASATSYSFLLFPVAAVVLGAWLAKETVTAQFLLGGGIVLAGVWLGAFKQQTPKTDLEGSSSALAPSSD